MSALPDSKMTLSNGKGGFEASSAASATEDTVVEDGSESFPEVSLLPLVHSILHTIEKDTQDVTQKNRESLEASMKVLELSRKVESARNHVYKMQGINYSKETQRQRLENLRKQLEMKKNLITKYKKLDLKLSGINESASTSSSTTTTTTS